MIRVASGRPLRMLHDRRSVLRNMAWGERERAPQIAMTGGGFRPKELYVGNETSTMKDVVAFYERSTFMPVRPRRRSAAALPSFVPPMMCELHKDPPSGSGWLSCIVCTTPGRLRAASARRGAISWRWPRTTSPTCGCPRNRLR